MSVLYDRFPLKFKLPERNGGEMTDLDAFPGMFYYTDKSDVLFDDRFSSVFSESFNVFSSSVAPRLIRYVPASKFINLVYYKGIYIYNPSIEKDLISYETERFNIDFSINGGNSFSLEDEQESFYEGDFFINDLNDTLQKNRIGISSANSNVTISISPSSSKNRPLRYFELDGTSIGGSIINRNYVPSTLGVSIPSLLPGEYLGLYLKFEISFSIDSKPRDYCFFNLNYNNAPTNGNGLNFPATEIIPGASIISSDQTFYNQSYSLRFDTTLNDIKNRVNKKIDLIYDNYPPFFMDYREAN